MTSPIGKLGILFVLMLVAAGVGLTIGPVSSPDETILFQIRLPRILLGLLVGWGLAGAGSVLQGMLRNPLADPFILGTSSAATAGVMAAGLLGLRESSAIFFFALTFALISVYIVYRIASVAGRTPVQTLVLAGVIVSLFFNALVFIFFSIFYREQYQVLYYLLGTLTEGDTFRIAISATLILTGLAVAMLLSRDLNLLTQGEDSALHLGVSVETTKKLLFLVASTMVAGAVAVSGMIGFVGLIIPHMMRILVGPDHRVLIPASAMGGAIFLLIADALARILAPPLEIPVGAITALIGSPYFAYLLRKRHQMGSF